MIYLKKSDNPSGIINKYIFNTRIFAFNFISGKNILVFESLVLFNSFSVLFHFVFVI